MTELDTIGQVRVELAELRGMMTTVVTDHGRRITGLEDVTTKIRGDLTAVNDNLHSKIATLLESGNKRAAEIEKQITTNTANITELRQDVTTVESKQYGLGARVAQYVSPVLATAALFFAFYDSIKR